MSERPEGSSSAKGGAAQAPLSGDQVAAFAEQAKRIVEAFWQRQVKDGFSIVDPLAIGHAFLELGNRLMADPNRLAEAQAKLWQAISRFGRRPWSACSGSRPNRLQRPRAAIAASPTPPGPRG